MAFEQCVFGLGVQRGGRLVKYEQQGLVAPDLVIRHRQERRALAGG